MSLNELEVIAGFLERAICPEDVFGQVKGAKELKVSYRKLAKAVHPDAHNGDPKAASLAKTLFQQLEEIHNEAVEKLTKNTYGDRKPRPSKIPVVIKSKYVCEKRFKEGQIADLYLASIESSTKRNNLIVKVARSADDNDLIVAEKNIANDIFSKLPATTWQTCIPSITDSFLLDDGKAFGKRRANVIQRFDGFLDCTEILNYFGGGKIEGRTLAWMWKRLLVLMEWTYKLGYIHGAVLPPHVMFYPDNDGGKMRDPRKHSIRLIDWCYAIDYKNRTRLSAYAQGWENLYAPEILSKGELGPWTDLYMGAQTMLYLQGPNPENVPIELSKSWESCIIKETNKRPQSIGKYFEEFDKLLRKIYGAPKYHEFIVPGLRA